ncbi:MAG: protoglobin domain-containing protein [Methylococcales bacterium]
MNNVGHHAKVISSLVNFTQRDRDLLQEEMELILEWIPDIVKDFFDTVYECPETRAIFREGERGRLEKTLTAWVFDILSGYEDSEFWEYQWVIALVHMKRQVKNIHVAGMMNRIQQVVLIKCQESFDPDKAVRVFSAFLRITGMTTALIVECYTELQEFITEKGLESVGVRSGIVARIRQKKLDAMMSEITTSRKDA